MPAGGPGRSSVVFRPSEQGEVLIRQLAGETWDREEWETVKAHIIQALQAGQGGGYESLLEEILARLPERKVPLVYTAEMATAVILSLHQLREEAPSSKLWERLRDLGLPEEVGLKRCQVCAIVPLGRLPDCQHLYANSWLLAHSDRSPLVELELLCGLTGDLLSNLRDCTCCPERLPQSVGLSRLALAPTLAR